MTPWYLRLTGMLVLPFVVACAASTGAWPAFPAVEIERTERRPRKLVLPSAYEAFMRGQIAFGQENYGQAERQFRKALRTDPNSSYLLAWVAKAEVRRQRLDRAKQAIDGALEADGCSEFAYCVAADILVARQDWTGAMRALTKAIECVPRQREAYLRLARLFERRGAPERAEETLLALVEVRADAAAHRELTRLALARNDRAEAVRHLAAVLALAPWHGATARELAALQLHEGDITTARALLETVVSRHPRDLPARRLLVNILLALGLTDRAGAHLDEWPLAGDDPGALAELALLLRRAHRYEEAVREAERSLALDRSNPEARQVLVGALRHIPGQQATAERRAGTWPSGAPGADGIQAELAQGLWESGAPQRALQLVRDQLGRTPNSPRCRQLGAQMLIALDKQDDGERLLAAGRTQSDRNAWARYLFAQGRLEAAAAATASDEDPSWQTLIMEARLRFRQDRTDEGTALLERAREAAPLEPEVWALHGERLYATGKRPQGLAIVGRAHHVQPDSPDLANRFGRLLLEEGRCDDAGEVARRGLRLSAPGGLHGLLDELAEGARRCPRPTETENGPSGG